MARLGSPMDTGDRFPEMTFQLTSGENLNLPADAGSGYAVILFYRGHW